MSNGAFLRYFCHVTSHANEGLYGDLGYVYFLALMDASFEIRVISINMAGLNARRYACSVCEGDGCEACKDQGYIVQQSRWEPFSNEFTRSVPKSYVNIICGDNGELARLYTLGVKNVAITSAKDGAPSAKEVIVLKEYDAVICPHESDAEVLRLLGIDSAMHVSPASIARFLKGFL